MNHDPQPTAPHPAPASLRERVRSLVESAPFTRTITTLIVVNAIVLGLETSAPIVERWGELLHAVNLTVVIVFTIELVLKLWAYGWRFFRDGWNLFDLFVVVISWVPVAPGAQVLRVLRVLRVMRLLSQVRSMRRVVNALLASIPGIASIGGLLVVIGYVFVVASTMLYGTDRPQDFGDLGASTVSLFRLLNGDGWGEIVQPLSELQPSAWPFFMVYGVLTTFVVLNLFIAVTTEALNIQREAEDEQLEEHIEEHQDAVGERILAELAAVRAELALLRAERELDT
ncbi:ion transporter [Agrococcus sp. ARC_14]|uniref:ion transporter n=1 Tax=Agrococcus sp. ARC_14 TaxID=2919927 RepID=UPI001F05726F|nr:ion transporter [Agrococcus sp. ARC_14]